MGRNTNAQLRFHVPWWLEPMLNLPRIHTLFVYFSKTLRFIVFIAVSSTSTSVNASHNEHSVCPALILLRKSFAKLSFLKQPSPKLKFLKDSLLNLDFLAESVPKLDFWVESLPKLTFLTKSLQLSQHGSPPGEKAAATRRGGVPGQPFPGSNWSSQFTPLFHL